MFIYAQMMVKKIAFRGKCFLLEKTGHIDVPTGGGNSEERVLAQAPARSGVGLLAVQSGKSVFFLSKSINILK